MAEIVCSLFDYREPPTLDSDGETSKPPPPRGRGCGRKRKGTPVKVCDRVFATEDDEESTSEHSYGPEKGDGCEETENRHRGPDTDGPYYETQSAQLCVGEEGTSGGRGTGSYPSPPNCRIREVHCGNQVRLIVIAIRDITKGEEITVDYSLTEWGENAVGFHGTVPLSSFECTSDHESHVKKIKDEESGRVPLSVSEYLTPSWSLSPSSSPLSHSEPSDSDRDSDEANAEPRMRAPQRHKKHKASSATTTTRKPLSSHPPSFPCSLPSSSLQPTAAPSRPVFKCPAPVGVPANSVSVSVGRGQSTIAQKQRCVYCRRHFRSLPRHLNKHHANQPDVRSALDQAHSSDQRPCLQNSLPSSSTNFQCPQEAHVTGVVVGTPQSPPTSPIRKSPALSSPTRKSPAPQPTTPPRRGGVPVSVLKRSPPTPATLPKKGGRKIKKEKEDVNVCEKTKEDKVNPAFVVQEKKSEQKCEKEEREENGDKDDESGAEDKNDLSSLRRPHMLPLLSSLSSLVLYLRRLQHSAFISLSRSPQSAEAWRLLCHSSLALLILFNRRRECEVSKLTITEYQARVTPQCPVSVSPGAPQTLTPLEAALSPFERMVLPHLPRAGVQGKRGRVQPLILPPHSEACLEMLLQTRAGIGIDPQNPYVFARPYHSPATPLRGTDLLRSLARASGSRHPRALTQTRVRRQVAILTQLLLLSEVEEEGQRGAATQRLESFLQKEYHVTQSCATIGQDPGLMGLIGRVVLCGERDGVLFRGMSLHHICLELDVLSGNSADSLSEESDAEQSKVKPETTSPSTTIMMKKTTSNNKSPRPKKMSGNSSVSVGRKRTSGQPKPGKRGVLKRPWSEAERAAVESHLVRNIMELRVPAKADCERCLELCPLLVTNHRDWRAVKFYCHNRIQLLKKTQQRQGPSSLPVC
nr:uncharacterized protein si:dkey-117m1.4 [Misgurnus anguillicaudatus]